MPKKILEKEITQKQQPNTAGYLDTKDQNKIKSTISLYLKKWDKKTINKIKNKYLKKYWAKK